MRRRATRDKNRRLPREVVISELPEWRAVLRDVDCFFCLDEIVGVSVRPIATTQDVYVTAHLNSQFNHSHI